MSKNVIEYVWLDANSEFRSKLRTLVDSKIIEQHDPVKRAIEVPWWNYDGSSTGQATGKDSEVILVPINYL